MLLIITTAPAEAYDPPTPAPTAPVEEQTGSDTERPKDTDGDKVLDRPDRVAAMSTAIAEKKKVEDLSARTATTSSFANPDGSWTVDTYSAPVRGQDDKGEWKPLDSKLVEDDDSLRPSVSAIGSRFSDGGDKTFARVKAKDGQDLSFGWETKLAKPTVKDNVATYADAIDGGDLVVTATAEGFSHDVLLRERPTGTEPLEIRVPLGLDGATARVTARGAIEIKDGKDLIASAPVPVMFDDSDLADGKTDADRDVTRIEPTIEGTGKDTTLVLRPDMDFLTNPETSYPVTIDPSFVLTSAADTWVQSTGDTTSQLTSPELHVGSNTGGTTKARTYIYFDLSSLSLPSGSVQSANLALSNFETGSCTGSDIEVSRITGGWTLNTITWANQPAVTSTGAATSNGSFGATGCATETDVNFDMKTIFEAWLGGATNLGVRVAATNETAASGWRKYRANDSGMATKIARLTVTTASPPTTSDSTVIPAVSDGSNLLTPQSRPTFTTSVSDPDGGSLVPTFKLTQGSTTVEETALSAVTAGSLASRKPSTDLADGTYEARWKVSDGTSTSSWSDPITVVVDTTPPPAPTISCPSTTHLAWYDTKPTSSTNCTVTVGSGTETITAKLNGADGGFPALSGGSTSKSFDLPNDGMFDLKVVARDKAGNPVSKAHTFGIGNGALTSPGPSARSTDTFALSAISKAGAASAQLQWRLAGDTTWIAATQVKQGIIAWPGLPTTDGNMSNTGNLTWNAAKESGAVNPSMIQARMCFNYSGTPSQRCTTVTDVSLVPHAFGGSFPTSEMGPADVSLMTGEFQLDEEDVAIPSYTGGLSLSRTYQSYGEPAAPAQGVFGPGWIANLDGPDVGVAGMQVVDKTSVNGTISLLDFDGETSTYKFKTGGTTAQAVGIYKGEGEAATYNERLEIKSGTPKTLVLTEGDGMITTWNHAGSGKWTVKNVVEPTSTPATTYSYDGDLVSGIYAGVPGVTCNATTQAKGCRALLMNYTTIAGQKRLTSVNAKLWDPKPTATGVPGSGAAMESTVVMQYAYDSSGKLIEAWDPRETITSGQELKSTYTYQNVSAKTYLASVTDPGEKTWNFNVDSAGRLDTVTRPQDSAVGGADATWRIAYTVPLSGTGLPNLSTSEIGQWGQTTAPTEAAAVFGPDAPGTNDMEYAQITYFTTEGQTTNTATFGADAWQFDAANYDTFGNVTSSIDEGNRATAAAAGTEGPATGYILSDRSVYSSDGTRVEIEVGPTRTVYIENGNMGAARTRTEYVYDDEAAAESVPVPGRPTPSSDPDDPKPNIVVEERHGVTDSTGSAAGMTDVKKSRYRYDKVVSTDGDGWDLQTPTRTSTSLGSGWSTTLTRYDTEGKLLETRTPQGVAAVDGAGSDARSTVNVYFTADASSPVAACRNRPEWVGTVCQSGRAGPTSATPTTVAQGFDYLLNNTRTVETSSPMTRTSVNTFDAAGRIKKKSVTMAGALATDKPVDDTTYTYSPTTGALTTTVTGSATATKTYDTWGRVRTQTDGAGNTATSTYDTAGRVKTADDGKGTYTYTYDGTDALGRTERRGMVTKVDVGLASGPDEFTAAYDPDGAQQRLVYPNGMTADTVRDAAGDEISLTYKKDGTQIAAFSQAGDRDGKVRLAYSPLSVRTYSYDDRDRLTTVQDGGWGGCTTREYTFSLDSNRTSLATSGPASGGGCSTTSPTTETSTFLSDDRISNSGYFYDQFGRTRNIPATHTDQPSGGVAAVAYHANDMVARIAQQVPASTGPLAEKNYTLDALGRIGGISDKTSNVELRRVTNHYADDSDSPAWIAEKTRPNSTTAWADSWTRNIDGPGEGLALIQSSDGTSKIQIANMHGDIVSTMANSTTVTSLANYAESTEYGLPRVGSSSTLGQNYGWLGEHQRSQDSVGGFTLMGARLYNPSTGRFLSHDPVEGGNDNSYVYPTDPINQFDTTGERKWGKPKLIKTVRKAGRLGRQYDYHKRVWGTRWQKLTVTRTYVQYLYSKKGKRIGKRTKKVTRIFAVAYACQFFVCYKSSITQTRKKVWYGATYMYPRPPIHMKRPRRLPAPGA